MKILTNIPDIIRFVVKKTLFESSERTFSNTPNGRATDVGIPIQDGSFPFI